MTDKLDISITTSMITTDEPWEIRPRTAALKELLINAKVPVIYDIDDVPEAFGPVALISIGNGDVVELRVETAPIYPHEHPECDWPEGTGNIVAPWCTLATLFDVSVVFEDSGLVVRGNEKIHDLDEVQQTRWHIKRYENETDNLILAGLMRRYLTESTMLTITSTVEATDEEMEAMQRIVTVRR